MADLDIVELTIPDWMRPIPASTPIHLNILRRAMAGRFEALYERGLVTVRIVEFVEASIAPVAVSGWVYPEQTFVNMLTRVPMGVALLWALARMIDWTGWTPTDDGDASLAETVEAIAALRSPIVTDWPDRWTVHVDAMEAAGWGEVWLPGATLPTPSWICRWWQAFREWTTAGIDPDPDTLAALLESVKLPEDGVPGVVSETARAAWEDATRAPRPLEFDEVAMSTVRALRHRVGLIPGVESVEVFENPTPEHDGVTPPHSITVSVAGPADLLVVEAVAREWLPLGCGLQVVWRE